MRNEENMKYLKKYNKFNEFSEFDISTTDDVDVKLAKGQLDEIQKELQEYKQKKSTIEGIFNKYKTLAEIEPELLKIIGKENKNQFLIEFTHILKLEKEITNIQAENVNDKIRIDDFQQEYSLATDSDSKSSINSKMSEIKNRMSDKNKRVIDIQKEITDSQKEHTTKMLKTENDLKQNIQKISLLK